MTRGYYWVLVDREPVAASLEVWSKTHGDRKHRRVAWTEIHGWYRISTVFLGLDHNFSETGPPLLFETMVFPMGNTIDLWAHRTATWAEAEHAHEEGCMWAKMQPEPEKENK